MLILKNHFQLIYILHNDLNIYCEDLTVNSAEVSGAVEKSIGRKLQDEDLEMLNLLQNVHDFDHPEEWKLHLKGVGLRYFNKDLHQLKVLRGF